MPSLASCSEQGHGCQIAISHDLKSNTLIAVYMRPSEWIGPQASRVDGGQAGITHNRLNVLQPAVSRNFCRRSLRCRLALWKWHL